MTNRWRVFILIMVAAVLVMCSLGGCGSGTGDRALVENGVIDLDGVTVGFGENTVPDGDSAYLQTVKATDTEMENGLSSALYELTLTEAYTQPVTLTFPVPEGFPGTEDEALLVGLGVECTYDSGDVGTEYFYFPAEVADGTAGADFIPEELLQAPLYMGAGQGSATPSKMETGVSLTCKCGLFTSVTYFADGGHFRLYYPMKLDGKFFHDIVGTEGRAAILNDLEATYEKYKHKSLGYAYKDQDFPMNVLVKKINDAGSYHVVFKDITLNTGNFTGKYVPGSLNSLLWHEFFHYVQGCYTGTFGASDWIDEATASYYEASASGVSYTALTAQYFPRQFTGALPVKDTPQDGYARAPLIAYLCQKMDDEAWIRTVYENGGTQEALIEVVGDPSGWAHDYYTALAAGKVGQHAAYNHYKNLTTGGYEADVGTTLKLSVPDTAGQIKESSGGAVVLGETSVAVPGQGCRLVAITVDEKELKKLPDGIQAKVECKDAKVTVLAVKGRTVTNCGRALTGLKGSAKSKAEYLAVVSSKAAPGTTANYDVKVKLSVEKINYTGTYAGVLHNLQNDKDIKVTTVVTYEKDFGDGAYYKIVCSDNGDSERTFINNSYFVRTNGEANIAGAEFIFTPDGQSFTATMLEFDGKPWGTISGHQ